MATDMHSGPGEAAKAAEAFRYVTQVRVGQRMMADGRCGGAQGAWQRCRPQGWRLHKMLRGTSVGLRSMYVGSVVRAEQRPLAKGTVRASCSHAPGSSC